MRCARKGDTAVLHPPAGSQRSSGPELRSLTCCVTQGKSPRLSGLQSSASTGPQMGLRISTISLGADQGCRRRTQPVPFLTKTGNVNLARRKRQTHHVRDSYQINWPGRRRCQSRESKEMLRNDSRLKSTKGARHANVIGDPEEAQD